MVSLAGLVAKDKATLWRVVPLGCAAVTESGLETMTRYAKVKRITYTSLASLPNLGFSNLTCAYLKLQIQRSIRTLI